MRKFLSVSTCFSLVLILTGCNLGDPTPWGRGYSSYDEQFKSAPAPEARDVGYSYNNDRNNAVIEFIRPAAQDLVEQLDAKMSFSIDTIYLKMPANTAFYNSFDYVLREEFAQNGYELVSSPKNSVQVDFVAKGLSTRCADSGNNNMYLALAINTVKGIPSDFVDGFYEVPLYDYKEAGSIKIEVPSCK